MRLHHRNLISYRTGFARSVSESAYPQLWRGLVGAWVPALGQTGLQLRDVSGRGNHGTLTNIDPATDWVVTERGYALDFDGSDDEVLVPANLTSSAFSFSSWVYPRTTGEGGGGRVTEGKHSSDNFSSFLLMNASEPGFTNAWRATMRMSTVSADSYSDNTVSFNTWQHLVFTYNDNGDRKIRLYKDGKEVTYTLQEVGSGTIDPGGAELRIGNRKNGDKTFDGFIDDVHIYNRTLTPEEILLTYQVPLAPFQLRPRRVWMQVAANLSVSVSDTSSVAEFADADLLLPVSANDAIAVAESTTFQLNPINLDVADNVTVAGFVDVDLIIPVSVTDAIIVDEIASVQLNPINLNVFDTVSLAEFVGADLILQIAVTDGITLSESVTLQMNPINLEVIDSVTVAESVALAVGVIEVLSVSVSDTISVAELVQADLILPVSVFDAVTADELVALQVNPLNIAVSDLIGIAESVALALNPLNIAVSDTVSLAESVSLTIQLIQQFISGTFPTFKASTEDSITFIADSRYSLTFAATEDDDLTFTLEK